MGMCVLAGPGSHVPFDGWRLQHRPTDGGDESASVVEMEGWICRRHLTRIRIHGIPVRNHELPSIRSQRG